jgi:hypothetical protein
MMVGVVACGTLVRQPATASRRSTPAVTPTTYAWSNLVVWDLNRQQSNLAVWDLVIRPAVESKRRRSCLETEARAAPEAAIIVERAAVRDAALTLAASAAAEQAAAERAAAERAAAERAAASTSTLFNVAMPPLPLQQGGARLLLREDMGMEEQDASLSASRPTGGSIWPCAAALCRWLGDNADAVRPHSSPPSPTPWLWLYCWLHSITGARGERARARLRHRRGEGL